MDEYISKQVLIRIFNAKADMALGTPKAVFSAAAKMVEKLPAADVVRVVRCKDCEYWEKGSDSAQGRCDLTGNYPTGTWFCANGERNEEK